MKNKYLILIRLFIAFACFSPVRTESDEEDIKEGKSDISGPLDVKKSEELSVEGKSGGEVDDLSEARVERSSKALSDEKLASDEVKSGIDINLRKSSPDDDNKKSSETFRKDVEKSRSDFENDTDDLVSERSIPNISEEEVEEKTASEDESSNKNDDVDNEDLSEKVGEVIIDPSRSIPQETQDVLLDSKVRTAQSSAEEIASPENDAGFEQRSNDAANTFGSRRSLSEDSSRPFGHVNLERSGDLVNEPVIPIPDQISLQFTKIPTEETFLPYPLIKTPLRSNDPISSTESRPLEEFNDNPFSNSYPYAYKSKPLPLPTLPTSPTPIEEKKPADLLPKFPQTLEIYPPQVKFFAENSQPLYPVTFKPAQPNLPFPAYNSYLPRFNRLPNPPFFYRQKCPLCS